MGDNIKRAIHKYYDNSYENIGSYNSFTWYLTLPTPDCRDESNVNQARTTLGSSLNSPIKTLQRLPFSRRHPSTLRR